MSQTTKPQRKALSIPGVLALTGLLFIGFLCFFAARWFVNVYGRIGFDSILFTLQSSLDGVQSDLVLSYLMRGLAPALACTGLCCFVLFQLRSCPLPRLVSVLTAVALALGLTAYAAVDVELTDYIRDLIWRGNLYEEEYVAPDSIQLTAPEEKRNLIYIMLESMETTYFDTQNGGAMAQNLIPQLTALAEDNLNFSHTDGVGGFHATNGASWTIAAMVAQTAGIPLKTPSGNQNDYGQSGEQFLPGVTSITDILEDAGYYTALMVGSDANFGGRKPYFTQHGMDRVYDIYTARKDGIVPRDYFVWWGMEDLHLFEYDKQELTEISQREEPFAFTMLTVDTHHIGGYQCAYCTDEFEETYEQSISCSDRQVLEFVSWLQEQPFYENTTVVVTGDHLSMDNGYFQRNVDGDFERMVYNCILNSPIQPAREKNREYCGVDLFPTTLAALGFEIPGDRLGLGTNLFSDTPTLAEKWGYERFNAELSKASDYYEEHFHQ